MKAGTWSDTYPNFIAPRLLRPMGTRRDPRIYQIGILSALTFTGITWLNFDIQPLDIVINIASTLTTQWLCTRWFKLKEFDPKSPLISALSLTLLLRTDSALIAITAGTLAILSKFLIRIDNKHVFNPTNFAIVVMLTAGGSAWVSPGQWGRATVLLFAIGSIGIFITHRSERSDVTIAFLLAYFSLVFMRSTWLGDPLAIPLHHLQSGALYIFAFFMISDPKTTPNSRSGRIAFAILVAALAVYIQYGLYRQNGIMWSLLITTTTVPLLNKLLPGRQFKWTQSQTLPSPAQRKPA